MNYMTCIILMIYVIILFWKFRISELSIVIIIRHFTTKMDPIKPNSAHVAGNGTMIHLLQIAPGEAQPRLHHRTALGVKSILKM